MGNGGSRIYPTGGETPAQAILSVNSVMREEPDKTRAGVYNVGSRNDHASGLTKRTFLVIAIHASRRQKSGPASDKTRTVDNNCHIYRQRDYCFLGQVVCGMIIHKGSRSIDSTSSLI